MPTIRSLPRLPRAHASPSFIFCQRRTVHDGRNRLSNFWTPTVSRKPDSLEDGHDLLIRAGFLRQAHSGIFHMLPLGLRVLDKIECLIEKHMQRIGASKVSLSSLSSQDLWRKSGRLDGRNAELFHLEDRKKAKFLLAPTHEEEITTAVKDAVQSYKDLPLRVYQVSRKYRDEARPRQGLLRGREFIMKDLYTFDVTETQAMKTYEEVRGAYQAFLEEFNLPYLVATADSGNMGGSHSHEYHFASSTGEDTIIRCTSCGLSINEELYVGRHDPSDVHLIQSTKTAPPKTDMDDMPFRMWIGRVRRPNTNDRKVRGCTSDEDLQATPIVQVFVPKHHEVNMRALKKLVPELDTAHEQFDLEQLGNEYQADSELLSFCDPRLSRKSILDDRAFWDHSAAQQRLKPTSIGRAPFLLTKAQATDPCPGCGAEGTLEFNRAVEIGHTFHLGKRYSKPLEANVKTESNNVVPIEMGCHGIGISRIIGTVASLLADQKGLNWPVALAPFSVLVTGIQTTSSEDVNMLYDELRSGLTSTDMDIVIDDRAKPLGWRLNDADLIGYPFIVVLGKGWSQDRRVELQCRRLGFKEEVNFEDVAKTIRDYRQKL